MLLQLQLSSLHISNSHLKTRKNSNTDEEQHCWSVKKPHQTIFVGIYAHHYECADPGKPTPTPSQF